MKGSDILVPLPLLFAFLWGQGAISFGLAAYFFAMHIPLPQVQQLPIVQERLRTYPAWRRKFIHIYPLTASLVMLLGVALCLILVGINAYAGAHLRAPYARPTDFATALGWAMAVFVIQAFLIAMSFLQWWRGRRALRRMAREATQRRLAAPEDTGQPASSAAQ